MPSTADERREQDRQLEGDRDELRPAVERLAADVERIGDLVHPVLQPEAAEQPGDAADEHDQRQPAIVVSRAPPTPLRSETASTRPSGGSPPRTRACVAVDERRRRRRTRPSGRRRGGSVSRRPSVPLRLRRPSLPAASSASRRSRSSAGTGRTGRTASRNRPIVPTNVAQSQIVGVVHAPRRGQEVAVQAGDDDHEALEPHADVDDHRDHEQSDRRSCARCLNHSNCGVTTLQRISVQYIGAVRADHRGSRS